MNKYIDADKLRAEIERRKNQTERRLDNIVPIRRKDTMDEEQLAKIELRDKVDKAYLNGVLITLSDILPFIASLQQEQPMPRWIHANYSDKPEIRYTPSGIPYLQNRAYMIWLSDLDTLPKNGTDLTNPIQEQQEVDKDFFFDEILKVYECNNKYPPRSEEELTMLETVARHFYELGKSARKEE